MQQSIIPPPPIIIVVAQSAPENLLSLYVAAAVAVDEDMPAADMLVVGVLVFETEVVATMEEGEGEDRVVIVTVTKSEIAFESVADAELAELVEVDMPRCSEDAALGKENTIGTLDILGELFRVFWKICFVGLCGPV